MTGVVGAVLAAPAQPSNEDTLLLVCCPSSRLYRSGQGPNRSDQSLAGAAAGPTKPGDRSTRFVDDLAPGSSEGRRTAVDLRDDLLY